jgi:hypothetical protein
MIKSLSKAIERTIDYGEKYGVKYTTEDVFFRLIGNKSYALDKIPKIIKPTTKKYYKEKLKKAKELALKLTKKFRSVEMAGITGSVAAEYPKKDDDIDLMVITKKDSLWITRLGIRGWIWIKQIPHRKYNQKQNGNEFCFNLWLEEDSLKLPKNKQNLKNAMDLILMKPIVNKNKTYERFILENKWAEKYVKNGYSQIISNPPARRAGFKFLMSNKKEKINILKKIINWVAFKLQYFYMRRKFKGERVDLKRAFFHPEG